jgi:hypothetical protein
MRFKRFYTFLILFFLGVLAGSFAKAAPFKFDDVNLGAVDEEEVIQVKDSKEVRPYFDLQIKHLKSVLVNTADPFAKITILKRSLSDIQAYRNSKDMADVMSEIYMDVVTRSLQDLPDEKEFEPKQCGIYKSNLLLNYEPTAQENEQPEDPAVVQALQILKTICG